MTRALYVKPRDVNAGISGCDAYPAWASPTAPRSSRCGLRQIAPLEQQVVARLATAWRLMGDPRYRTLYDYDNLVRPYVIDTPPGWADLTAYLADLAAALKALHAFETHPFDQSLRGGSQTSQDLGRVKERAVRAFFQAIDGPIRRYMEEVGPGDDILRQRNTHQYYLNGTWSVMLRPNGFHIDHTHPSGWLSSACYIELPEAVEKEGREGWIKFGEPGIPTSRRHRPSTMCSRHRAARYFPLVYVARHRALQRRQQPAHGCLRCDRRGPCRDLGLHARYRTEGLTRPHAQVDSGARRRGARGSPISSRVLRARRFH